MKRIPLFIDRQGDRVKFATEKFVNAHSGKVFLSIVLLGPATFIPTLWVVWTANNIDAFRTLTWPLMLLTSISSLLGAVHYGDWRMKLVMTIWTLVMVGMILAILIR